MTIAEREAAGGTIPEYARNNTDLYHYDTESGTYRRNEGVYAESSRGRVTRV
jgi:hypothetical protein